MQKDDWKNILMIIATLIVTIVSLGFFSLFGQLLFIIIFLIICCLSFSYLNNKSKRKRICIIAACTIEFLILGTSIFKNGSFINFGNRIKNFFVSPQETSSDSLVMSNIEFESYFNSINEKIDDIDQKVENTNNNIQTLDKNLNLITNNLDNIQFNEHVDEIEIEKISKLMEDKFEAHNDEFPNIKNDLYSIELLYKAFISEEPYYYCNILKAFDQYGINTDKLGISENCLFIWDIERLYMTYNMKNSIAAELESDEILDEKRFYYNEYRVSLNRFSDTFDYGNWNRYFTDNTAKQIDDMLDVTIMNFYKKFVINFSSE